MAGGSRRAIIAALLANAGIAIAKFPSYMRAHKNLGMIQVREGDFDAASFWRTAQDLPTYAQPRFVRVLTAFATTGTFKMVKGDLRKEGYDLAQVTEPLFVLKPRSEVYEPLDEAFAEILRAGEAGY